VTATADVDIDSAVGLVIADGYQPNGIAFDPSFAYTLATAHATTRRAASCTPSSAPARTVLELRRLNAAVSTTVSAPEATISGGAYASTNPNVKAIVGDFSAIRWGVQRSGPGRGHPLR
jgi:hypothetical protein